MTTLPKILTLALFAGIARAEDLKIGDTTYKNYSVIKQEPDGLKIEHSDGITKIHMEKLPADLAAKYKFDTAKAKAFREQKSAVEKKVAESQAEAEKKPTAKAAEKLTEKEMKPAVPAAAVKKEADPQGWENIPADPSKAQKGKTWGIAEVQEKMFDLDGQIIRVEVIVNSASDIEAIDASSARM